MFVEDVAAHEFGHAAECADKRPGHDQRRERSTSQSSWTQSPGLSKDTTSYLASGLSADTTYYFRVRANNSAGYSDYNNVASATTASAPRRSRACSTRGRLWQRTRPGRPLARSGRSRRGRRRRGSRGRDRRPAIAHRRPATDSDGGVVGQTFRSAAHGGAEAPPYSVVLTASFSPCATHESRNQGRTLHQEPSTDQEPGTKHQEPTPF